MVDSQGYEVHGQARAEAELGIQGVSSSRWRQAISQVSLEVRRGRVSIDWSQWGWKDDPAEHGQRLYHPNIGAIFLDGATLPTSLPTVLPRLVLHVPFRILRCFVV